VRSRASSFNWEYPLLSLRTSSSFLRLLPRLLVTSICPFIVPSTTTHILKISRSWLSGVLITSLLLTYAGEQAQEQGQWQFWRHTWVVEVLIPKIILFWNVMPCAVVDRSPTLRDIFCLSLVFFPKNKGCLLSNDGTYLSYSTISHLWGRICDAEINSLICILVLFVLSIFCALDVIAHSDHYRSTLNFQLINKSLASLFCTEVTSVDQKI